MNKLAKDEKAKAEGIVMGWIGFRMGGSVSRLAPKGFESKGDGDTNHEDAEAWCFDTVDTALSAYVESNGSDREHRRVLRSAIEDLLTATYWDSMNPTVYGRFAPLLLAGLNDALSLIYSEGQRAPMVRV